MQMRSLAALEKQAKTAEGPGLGWHEGGNKTKMHNDGGRACLLQNPRVEWPLPGLAEVSRGGNLVFVCMYEYYAVKDVWMYRGEGRIDFGLGQSI